MQRIDSSTTVGVIPTPDPLGTPGYFAHGNPATSTPYTVTTADWGNAIQEEIVNVIAAAGITLSKTNNAQLLAALQGLTAIRLTAHLTLNVATNGNDSTGTGTVGNPFATGQAAWNYLISHYNLNGWTATIKFANGTYTTPMIMTMMPMGSNVPVSIVGNNTTQGACHIGIPAGTSGACFEATTGVQVIISGFACDNVASTALGGWAFAATSGAVMQILNCLIGTTSNIAIASFTGAQVYLPTSTVNYIGANSTNLGIIGAHASGILTANFTNIVLLGAATCTFAFATSDESSALEATGLAVTSAGFMTGPRYSVSTNGVIATGGGGANYFPGTSAGSASNGGVYI